MNVYKIHMGGYSNYLRGLVTPHQFNMIIMALISDISDYIDFGSELNLESILISVRADEINEALATLVMMTEKEILPQFPGGARELSVKAIIPNAILLEAGEVYQLL